MLVETLERDVGAHLAALGRVFTTIEHHDSGNTSWGVEVDGRRWFVKCAGDEEGVGWLRSAIRFHAAVSHPRIVPLTRALPVAGGGLALVYPWVDGDILNDPFVPGAAHRDHPDSAHRRFRSLPPATIAGVIDDILDAHLAVVARGFVAVDFYDGCVIYDFGSGSVQLVDLDLYRPGPYVLGTDRQFGSTRFMAPEEFCRGATIDERTTVFNLGRTAFVFLSTDDRGDPAADLWRGSSAQYDVARRATAVAPTDRYPTLDGFVAAWRAAV